MKNPSLGNVKTRLADEIGEGAALAVYLKLLNHTLSVTSDLPVSKMVFYSDYVDTEDEWEEKLYGKSVQSGSDLGERMKNAFQDRFAYGFQKTCIVGSDIPHLSGPIIMEAFQKLDNFDAVVGPSEDGGYYLLGLKNFHPLFFENKRWGSNTVFDSTVADFNKLQLKYYVLPKLLDIDTKTDLEKAWPNLKWKKE